MFLDLISGKENGGIQNIQKDFSRYTDDIKLEVPI